METDQVLSVLKAEIKTETVETDTESDSQQHPVPEIGSRNSAFQPYRPLTILTNLQRGNVKTYNKDIATQSLTFHERAARGDLTAEEINDTNVNAIDCKGATPIMWAAFHGRLSTTQLLIEKGAQVDFRGTEGETSLMFAAANGHHDVIRYLLSKNAELEAVDDAGNTPLMYAANGNHPQCVSELLSSGASMTKPNGIGDTPFEITVSKGLSAAQCAMENHLRDFIETNILK